MMSNKSLILFALCTITGLRAAPINLTEDDPEIYISHNYTKNQVRGALKFLLAKEAEHVPSWEPGYALVSDAIEAKNLKIGCEIGVAFGTQSIHILEHTNVDKLYCIDPYKHFSPNEYHDGMNIEQCNFDILYLTVHRRLAPYTNRVQILRETSEQANNHFENSSLDFIYLDANHSYEGVWADLNRWFDKVRAGGLLIGDDYGHICFPGVKQAVDRFFRERTLKVETFPTGKWLVHK